MVTRNQVLPNLLGAPAQIGEMWKHSTCGFVVASFRQTLPLVLVDLTEIQINLCCDKYEFVFLPNLAASKYSNRR